MNKQKQFRMCIALFCLLLPLHTRSWAEKRPLNILHISFHAGCLKDFEEVCNSLGMRVTSWHILSYPCNHFDGQTNNLTIYNITHDRAENVWNKHKKFFDSFDVIVTSDIAPLARIFLQNGWKKPLIIWVCNRFDYYMEGTISHFPDRQLYDLFNQAVTQKNVKIINYTPYEYVYARHRGVDLDTYTIKPIGSRVPRNNKKIAVPATIKKSELLFVYPLDHSTTSHDAKTIQDACTAVGIPTYTGPFNGPDDVRDFKGIIYLPYQASSLVFWEAIARGIIFFVPSKRFLRMMHEKKLVHIYCMLHNGIDEFIDWMEWYDQNHQDIIVYFDSWQDLKNKVQTLDYDAVHANVMRYAQYHRQTVLQRWKEVFQGFSY